MPSGNFIGAMLVGGFFVYITLNGSLAKYIALLIGQGVQPTPVTGVANISATDTTATTPATTAATTPTTSDATAIDTTSVYAGIIPNFFPSH